jgi:hypothetical protein
VWRKAWDAALELPTLDVENEIIEYLHYDRHDLPPTVWIEFDHCNPRL